MSLSAFHINWTKPFTVRHPGAAYAVEPFELLTTALSALYWRKNNGSIRMICDSTAKRYYDTLGLSFLWDDGVYPLLDSIPADINPIAFWAAGKLYALAAMPSPCVMIDTDFIVWKPIAPLLKELSLAAIHREDIMPDIYPGPEAFRQAHGFDLAALDWTVRPFNTALAYFADDDFRMFYTDTAIRFMRSAPDADDVLTYMVFAEQRLLAMCAARRNIPAAALSDLPALFDGAQQGYFTHIWGFKQQMRDSNVLYHDFCSRCAARLMRDFPQEAEHLAGVSPLSQYFS
ncbi:MAG: hypothetical protein ACOYIE_04845 [Agathobaculum sp.]|jgi:hypothetical protein|uniref:DUF6734 family protein n=1 Tax=Agathobaculum sp. TaxID=2048138 RepID=UPI003D94201D